MSKFELVELLTCKNNKILIEGMDLSTLTNMYYLSEYDFLTLLRFYFKSNIKNIDSYIINDTYTDEYLSKNIYNFKNGELLVSIDKYKEMKKKVFDFAYIYCSNIGNDNFKRLGIISSNEFELEYELTKKLDTYSCIYKKEDRWFQKISNILIDEEDKQKRFRLINGD